MVYLKIWRGLITSKELKRLSRRELLEMLIEQMKENQRLRNRLEQAEAELENLYALGGFLLLLSAGALFLYQRIRRRKEVGTPN